MNTQEFAQSVRAKYPGAYDNISDQDLVSKVVSKYPQYQDQISDFNQSPQSTPQPSYFKQLVSNIPKDYPQAALNAITPAIQAVEPTEALRAAAETGKALYSNPSGTLSALTQPFLHPIEYTKEHPVQQALNLGMIGTSLGDIAESTTSGLSDISSKLADTLTEKPTSSDIETAVSNVQDALNTSRKMAVNKLNDVKEQFAESPDFQARVNRLGETSSLSDLKDEYNNYMQSRAPQMEEAGMQPPQGIQPQQIPNVQVYSKGVMGKGTPNETTIWGVKGDPAEISKLGYGNDPGSIPANVLQKFGLLDDSGNPLTVKQGPIFASSKEEIGYLINLRQQLQDKIRTSMIDQSGNTVKAVGSIDEGTIRGMISRINDKIGSLPGGDTIREAETHFSNAQSVFDDLQSKMAEPGQAEGFLKRVLTSDNPLYKDYRNKLATLENVTNQPVISNLKDLFQKQAAGITYEELKHPIASMIKSGLPQGLIKRSAEGVGNLSAAVSRGLQQPFNTPQMQSLKDRLNNYTRFKDSKYADQ